MLQILKKKKKKKKSVRFIHENFLYSLQKKNFVSGVCYT